MNTTGIVVVTISALTGGGVAAGGIVLGRAVHDLASRSDAAWRGYSVAASVKVTPRPEPKAEPADAAGPVPAGPAEPARSPLARDNWRTRPRGPGGQFLPAAASLKEAS